MQIRPLLGNSHSFYLIVVLYAVLHLALRLAFSPVLGTDDVEQAICAQDLVLGCDLRQPPLYTWLQWLTNQVAGTGLFAIFLLKYGLLSATYVFLYLAGRRLLAEPVNAALAALALWLAYPFAVSVHQGVTHSLLLSLLLAASFWFALRLAERRTTADYLLLGLLFGLGVLSKYSFALYAAALLLSALTLPRYRRAVLDPRVLLTLAVAVAVALPHFIWMWQRLDAVAGALGKVGQADAPVAYGARVASGLTSLASAVVQFLAPFWLILLAFHPRAFLPLKDAELTEPQRLVGRVLAFSIALLALVVLAGGPVEIKPRWMHAVALLGPLYLFARVEALGQPPRRGYLAVLFGFPVLIMALWAAQTYLAPKQGKPTRFHAPYDRIAAQLRTAGFSAGTIVTDGLHLPGNLRVAFPDARVLTSNYAHFMPAAGSAGLCLLAWETEHGRAMPERLIAYFIQHWGPLPDGQPGYLNAPYHGTRAVTMEIGYRLLPGSTCNR
jgi:4-amino-4-deoxy-L-arabinose transferase-like glycosyltransferase